MNQRSRSCFAVDIDNVLGRAEPEVQRLFQDITGTPWPLGRYGSAGGLDSSEYERGVIEEIFSRFHEESIPRLPLYSGAKYALNAIHQTCRIIIVTARRPYSRPQTLNWLNAHGLPFDALYHTEEKTDIPESITFAIDDHPEHLQRYQEIGARVLVMDHPWNRQFIGPEGVRVSGWDDVLQWWHVRQVTQWPIRFLEAPAPHYLWKNPTILA